MREQIIEMLSNGIPATNVAAALGCDDSYVSQILAEEGVANQVAANRAARFSDALGTDKKLEEIESKALNRLGQLVDLITKPTEAAAVYRTLNNANRKASGSVQQATPVAATVKIDLPAAAIVQFQLNAEKQVISIGDRSMVTMPAKTLVEKMEQQKAIKALTAQVPNLLPISGLVKEVMKEPEKKEAYGNEKYVMDTDKL